jgi:P-type Cu+ transporter
MPLNPEVMKECFRLVSSDRLNGPGVPRGGGLLLVSFIRDVVTALDLGKKTVSKIKQNLFWAFAYNTGLILIVGGVLVPLLGVGIFGWLPKLAGVAMAMSSVTVVDNKVSPNSI